MNLPLIIKTQALTPYSVCWEAMKQFTNERSATTSDQLWLLEHPPVFTQGQAGKAEHILNPQDIPIVQSDRGGQVTYHGPGQLIAYTLFDIKRMQLNTRETVRRIEQVVIDYLASLSIKAANNPDAPGVYVDDKKICSIGLRVRRGCSYHGIALNVNMNLTPFTYINPCGYQGMAMAQIADFQPNITMDEVHSKIIPYFVDHFGYNATVNDEEHDHAR